MRLATALGALLWLALPAAGQEALRGVALVIGQSDYDALPALENPENDALAIYELLGDLGFDVKPVLDADADDLAEEIAEFAEDAAGADVALVYYSGHGIEAGGENYLIPVDADVSTPDAAGQTLVPLGRLLDDLRAKVPVTIVLFDACRTNAFPDGQTIVLPGTDTPVAVSEIAGARGQLLVVPADETGHAAVIGFSASPGQVALDGDPGTNSPYAAALLKHFGAGGHEFGDVMTLVAREVYLETDTRQLPWVNASLQQFLTFGKPEPAHDADEAAIRDGRRRLLLSIEDTPESARELVVELAARESVEIDALFGMLQSLGVDTANPDIDLTTQIEQGAERLREFLDNPYAGGIRDAESERLAALVDQAIAEGAIDVAAAFGDRLIQRADAFADTLGEARVALAADYAKGAAANELNYDFATAAAAYGKAYAQVAGLDDELARHYKWKEANTLADLGDVEGDAEALGASIEAFRTALTLVERTDALNDWGMIQNDLGSALHVLGEREPGTERLQASVEAFDAALTQYTRDLAPSQWAGIQNNLGVVYHTLGLREAGAQQLEASIEAYRLVLEEWTREDDPEKWAMTQNNLGVVLSALGERDNGVTLLEEAAAAYRLALEVRTRENRPLEWALTQNNLGSVLHKIGEKVGDVAALTQSAEAYQQALLEFTHERRPMDWAMVQNNLGNALASTGYYGGAIEPLQGAVIHYRSALEEYTRERVPLDWAMTQRNLCTALGMIGVREEGTARLEEAVVACRAALEEQTAERMPLQSANTQRSLGIALGALGDRNGGTRELEEAAVAFRAAMVELNRDSAPSTYARMQTSLGVVLRLIGERTSDVDLLWQAIEAYSISMEIHTPEIAPAEWAYAADDIGGALWAIGELTGTPERMAEAKNLITWSRDIYEKAGQNHDAYFEERLGNLERATAAMTEGQGN